MALTIHVHSLATKNEPMEISGSIDLTEFVKSRVDLLKSSPLHVAGHAEYNAGLVDVNGVAKADMTFHCSRCLEPFDTTVEFEIHEGYTQSDAIAEADQEGNIHKFTGDEVDLRPALEENLQLALPFVPLCNEDCLGLCPECGVNRNEQTCSCKVEKIDPRLAGLQDFFKS